MQLPESLTHKLGPLPVWGWGAIIGGAWLAVGFLHGGSASSAAAGPFATAQGSDGGDGGGGDSGAYGGALNSPDTTAPVSSGGGATGGTAGGGGFGGGGGGSSASVGVGGGSLSDNSAPPNALTPPGGLPTVDPNAGASSTNANAPSGPSATYTPTTVTRSSTKSAPSVAAPSAGNVTAPLVGTGQYAKQVQKDPTASPTVTVSTAAGPVQVPTAVANLLGAASVNQVAAAAAQRPAQNTGSLTAPSNKSTKVAGEGKITPTTKAATTTKPKAKPKQENTGGISGASSTVTKAK